MRYQETTFSCGAAAVVNALRCFGKKVPEKDVRARAGTSEKDGTQEDGMMEALKSYGVDSHSFDVDLMKTAMRDLVKSLKDGSPVIICTQNLQHWVTVVGMVGDRFIVSDPAKTKSNMKENGVSVVSKKVLSKMWKSKNGVYSGIVVKKKK